MQRKFTTGSRQAPDPYDQFLESNNFFRKHTARDCSCLFRVISEQIYDTQQYHLTIRKMCVQYMRKHYEFFQRLVDRNLNEYLDEIAKPNVFGTLVELQAIAYMFQRNIILFEPFTLGKYIFQHNCNDVFRVFYTPEHHFDSVFTSDYIKDAAICQSICYEILYKDIFKLPDVEFAVEQMLHVTGVENVEFRFEYNIEGYGTRVQYDDGRGFDLDLPFNTNCILENYELCHFHCDRFPRISNELQNEIGFYENSNQCNNDDKYLISLTKTADALLPNKYISCVRQLLQEGITPFPYKVAKALDANMYRNIEFDAWNETRKEAKFNQWYTGDYNFKVGAKCYVRLHNTHSELYTCHIQEISVDKSYCIVFVERIGEKRLVPYEALSPLPPDEFKPWSVPHSVQRSVHRYSTATYGHNLYCQFRLMGSQWIGFNATSMESGKHFPYYLIPQLGCNDLSAKDKASICSVNHFVHLDNCAPQPVHYYTLPFNVPYNRTDITSAVAHNINAVPALTDSEQADRVPLINDDVEIIEFSPTDCNTPQNTELVISEEVSSIDALNVNESNICSEEKTNSNVLTPEYPYYYTNEYDYSYGYDNGNVIYFNTPQDYAPNSYISSNSLINLIHVGNNYFGYYMMPPTENSLVGANGIGGNNIGTFHDRPVVHLNNKTTINALPTDGNVLPPIQQQGIDLCTGVGTLHYFYNGVDYHSKTGNNESGTVEAKTGDFLPCEMQKQKVDDLKFNAKSTDTSTNKLLKASTQKKVYNTNLCSSKFNSSSKEAKSNIKVCRNSTVLNSSSKMINYINRSGCNNRRSNMQQEYNGHKNNYKNNFKKPSVSNFYRNRNQNYNYNNSKHNHQQFQQDLFPASAFSAYHPTLPQLPNNVNGVYKTNPISNCANEVSFPFLINSNACMKNAENHEHEDLPTQPLFAPVGALDVPPAYCPSGFVKTSPNIPYWPGYADPFNNAGFSPFNLPITQAPYGLYSLPAHHQAIMPNTPLVTIPARSMHPHDHRFDTVMDSSSMYTDGGPNISCCESPSGMPVYYNPPIRPSNVLAHPLHAENFFLPNVTPSPKTTAIPISAGFDPHRNSSKFGC